MVFNILVLKKCINSVLLNFETCFLKLGNLPMKYIVIVVSRENVPLTHYFFFCPTLPFLKSVTVSLGRG